MSRKNNSTVQDFFEINGKLEKIISQINSAKNALVIGNTFKYEEQLSKAVLSLEKQCLRMRDIANYSLKLNNAGLAYNKLCNSISTDAHGITVEKIDDYYKVSMPFTLPHYGDNNPASTSKFISQPLYNALRNYCKENSVSKLRSAVIVTVNHTDNCDDKTGVRDNDNYEYKAIINSLAFWFLPDDGYKFCNMFNTTKLSNVSKTTVYVVPSESFADFYQKNIEEIL